MPYLINVIIVSVAGELVIIKIDAVVLNRLLQTRQVLAVAVAALGDGGYPLPTPLHEQVQVDIPVGEVWETFVGEVWENLCCNTFEMVIKMYFNFFRFFTSFRAG